MTAQNVRNYFQKTLTATAGLLLAAAVLTTGCSHHHDDGYGYGGGPVATPYGAGFGPDASCLQAIPETAPGYGPAWNNYRQNNIQPYAWNQSRGAVAGGGGAGRLNGAGHNGRVGLDAATPYFAQFPSNGLCGCQEQTFPACGQQGLTCVPNGGFQGQQLAVWGYNNGNFAFNNFSGPGQFGGYSGYNNIGGGGCAAEVAQLCTPGQVTGNAICAPVSPGNPFGVWVSR